MNEKIVANECQAQEIPQILGAKLTKPYTIRILYFVLICNKRKVRHTLYCVHFIAIEFAISYICAASYHIDNRSAIDLSTHFAELI